MIMTSLCIVWGIQQISIKGTADEISPVLQVAIRNGAAAGLICLLIILKKTPLRNIANCLIPGGGGHTFWFAIQSANQRRARS
jgi:hypothetical protein